MTSIFAILNGSRFLWYDKLVIDWERAILPIGNVRVVGTVHSSLSNVLIINRDTIWLGPLQDRMLAGGAATLSKARKLSLQGNITGGGNLIMSDMN